MAARSEPLKGSRQRPRVWPGDPVATLWAATGSRWKRLGRLVGQRTPRPRVAMLGIPLGVAVALGSTQWWAMVPLTCGAWWYAPRDWGWEWLVAIGRGLLVLEWTTIGADVLVEYPAQRLVVAGLWALSPATLVVVNVVRHRRKRQRPRRRQPPPGAHTVIHGVWI